MPLHREVAEDKLTGRIIGAAIEIHSTLGPDHPEHLYREALAHGLREQDLKVEAEREIAVIYAGKQFGSRYADLVVQDDVVVELKAVRRVTDEHFYQLGTNVRLLELRCGLLINFGQLRIDVRRYANSRGGTSSGSAPT